MTNGVIIAIVFISFMLFGLFSNAVSNARFAKEIERKMAVIKNDPNVIHYENGVWTDYSVPFAIPAHQTTKVYARIGTTGRITYMNFSTTDDALGVYTESNTDFEF